MENEHGISISTEMSQFYDEIGMKTISKYFARRNFKVYFLTLMAYFLPVISGCVTSVIQKVRINSQMIV